MSVRGDKVRDRGSSPTVREGVGERAINNKLVASYDKCALVTTGKLKSTDGVYGLRSAHNTEVFVTGLKVTKP